VHSIGDWRQSQEVLHKCRVFCFFVQFSLLRGWPLPCCAALCMWHCGSDVHDRTNQSLPASHECRSSKSISSGEGMARHHHKYHISGLHLVASTLKCPVPRTASSFKTGCLLCPFFAALNQLPHAVPAGGFFPVREHMLHAFIAQDLLCCLPHPCCQFQCCMSHPGPSWLNTGLDLLCTWLSWVHTTVATRAAVQEGV
jgi:hypothetical protein